MEQLPCILALSADYTRLEAALVDTAGRIAHLEHAPVRILSTGSGQAYIDPGELLGTAAATIKALLERKPREARRLAGVGLIGRSLSVAFVDASGAATPFLLPEDDRSGENAARRDLPWDDVCAMVGLPASETSVPRVMEKASPDARGSFLTPKDFLKWALTGNSSTDPLDAQRTFLWDLSSRRYSDDLCRILGVNPAHLPPVAAPGDRAGAVTPEAARRTGLKEGLPVSCGMGDWGEYLGSGAFDTGDAFEHIGTTGAFYGISTERPAAAADLAVRPHLAEDLYLVGREGLPGGTCVEWLLKKSFLADDGEIDWPRVEEEFDAIAAAGRPENVLFFPSLSARTGQISNAAFLNLHIEDNLTSLIQGLMEGVFLELKAVAEEVKATGWSLGSVYTTGQIGFKHAPRRVRAHMYGARVHAGKMPGANIFSAALVGALAAGVYPTIEAARAKMLTIDGGTVPDEHTQALYEAHFASWLCTRSFLAPDRT